MLTSYTGTPLTFGSEAVLWPTLVHFHPTTSFISPFILFYKLIASLSLARLAQSGPSPRTIQPWPFSNGWAASGTCWAIGVAGAVIWSYTAAYLLRWWAADVPHYLWREASGGVQRSLNPDRPDTLIRAGRTSHFIWEQKSNRRQKEYTCIKAIYKHTQCKLVDINMLISVHLFSICRSCSDRDSRGEKQC